MFTSNQSGTSQWQFQKAPGRKQNADAARLKISELAGQLKIAKSHYTRDSDSDRQQTAIPLVRALRNFAEGWGEFGKYQEQDKDRIKSYTKQKEILETALAISRKGADHEKIAEILSESNNSNYSLKGFDKNNLDKEGVDPIEDAKTFHKLGNVHFNLKDLHKEEESREDLKKANEYYGKALNMRLETAKIMLHEFVNAHYSFNYPKAKECYEKIVNISKNMQLERANMLLALINANYNLNNPEEVKKCDEKVLEVSKHISQIPDTEMADILNNLGSVGHALGDYQKAEEYFEKALPIFKDLNGPNDIKVGAVSNNLGNVYRDLANCEKAKKFFTDALSIYKDTHGPEHIEVGIISNKLGNIYYSLADLQKENEAEESYKKAKNLHESALLIYKEFYGPNHMEVAEVLDNLDRDCCALNDYQEAYELHKKELVIYERNLASKERENPHSIEVAEVLRDLANTYYNLGNFEEARKLYERELEIREKYYGSDGPKIAKTLDNLGDTYLHLENYQKAKESFKKALEHYGSDNPIVTTQISKKLKKTTESLIKQLHGTLAEKRRNYPTGHLQIGQTLKDLGYAYGELGDYLNQKKSLEEALPILKEWFGHTNTTVVKMSQDLSNAKVALENEPSSILAHTSVHGASNSNYRGANRQLQQ